METNKPKVYLILPDLPYPKEMENHPLAKTSREAWQAPQPKAGIHIVTDSHELITLTKEEARVDFPIHSEHGG